MRPRSSPSDPLFGPLFDDGGVNGELDGTAWLRAMLDFERALVVAEAEAGLVPRAAEDTVAEHCDSTHFDAAEIGQRSVESGNPVIPLVRRLTELVPDEVTRYVHFGATSQDVLDSAAMLVSRRALDPLLGQLGRAAAACARHATTHRNTVVMARTLLQQALPTTFGLKAAGWLVALDEARLQLAGVRDRRLAVQFGGAAGTLASVDEAGVSVVGLLADELGLAEPVLPWHTNRTRFAELAGALGAVSGVLAKIARDVVLLAQTEVGEVAESTGGSSSAMPHKQNPVRATRILAATARVPALVATMMGTMAQEHERAAGNWHAEWETLTDLFRLVGGAAATAGELLDGLRVDADRMRDNVDRTGGLVLAESVTVRLAAEIGGRQARALVTRICETATRRGIPLRQALLAEDTVRAHLSESTLDAALDPHNYLGCAGAFVDRALAAHRAIDPPPGKGHQP